MNVGSWFRRKRSSNACARVLGKQLRLESLEGRRVLATLTVNLSSDGAITDDGNLIIREAVAYVNGTAPGPNDQAWIDTSADPLGTNDKIVFHSSLNGGIITLNQGTALSITKAVTIDASLLADGITIDASGNDTLPLIPFAGGSSVFDIAVAVETGTKDVLLKNLTLTGADKGTAGAIHFHDSDSTGFAILKVEDCIIENNRAQGGGIWANFGALATSYALAA